VSQQRMNTRDRKFRGGGHDGAYRVTMDGGHTLPRTHALTHTHTHTDAPSVDE
jgi:hypothetical protein